MISCDEGLTVGLVAGVGMALNMAKPCIKSLTFPSNIFGCNMMRETPWMMQLNTHQAGTHHEIAVLCPCDPQIIYIYKIK